MRKPISIFLLIIVVLSACAKKEQPMEKVFPVKVVTLAPKAISSTIILAGTVGSKAYSLVSAPVEGSINSLNVAEGDNVNPGKILCYIMPVDQQNILGQAHADYEHIKEGLGKAEELKDAEGRLESAKKLYKPIPVVSPIAGTIISKSIEVGSNVSIKQSIMEIADLNKLIIKSAISEGSVSKIKLGQGVKVRMNSLREGIFPGKLSVITPGIRSESRTADIEISIAHDLKARPGMTASIEIIVEQKQNILAIPQDIMTVKPNGDKYVFLAENDTAKMIKVTTGIESNTEIEIISGLNIGDKVVVMGQENLKDGAKIKLPEASKPVKGEGRSK